MAQSRYLPGTLEQGVNACVLQLIAILLGAAAKQTVAKLVEPPQVVHNPSNTPRLSVVSGSGVTNCNDALLIGQAEL